MDPIAMLGGGVLLPAVVAGGIAVAGGRRPWAVALAVPLAWAVGVWAVIGLPPFPPVEATHWLAWTAPLLPAWGVATGRVPAPAEHALRLLAGVALFRVMLSPLFEYQWQPAEGWAWVAGLAALLVAAWATLDRVVATVPARGAGLGLIVVTGGAALALGMTGSVVLGRLGGVVASGVGAVVVASFLRKDVPLRPFVPALAVLLVGLLVAGAYFSELPLGCAVALALAPVAGLLGRGEGRGWRAPVAVALPVVAALVTAFVLAGGMGGEAEDYGSYGSTSGY